MQTVPRDNYTAWSNFGDMAVTVRYGDLAILISDNPLLELRLSRMFDPPPHS